MILLDMTDSGIDQLNQLPQTILIWSHGLVSNWLKCFFTVFSAIWKYFMLVDSTGRLRDLKHLWPLNGDGSKRGTKCPKLFHIICH